MIYSYRTYMHFTYIIDITYDSLFIPLSAICLIYTVRLSVTHTRMYDCYNNIETILNIFAISNMPK